MMQKKVAEILPIQAMELPALLPIQAMKLPALLTIQAMKLPALPTPPPQDQMILMLWRWYNCCTCYWRLCIFCMQHFP